MMNLPWMLTAVLIISAEKTIHGTPAPGSSEGVSAVSGASEGGFYLRRYTLKRGGQ
jgi:hypothetical protein